MDISPAFFFFLFFVFWTSSSELPSAEDRLTFPVSEYSGVLILDCVTTLPKMSFTVLASRSIHDVAEESSPEIRIAEIDSIASELCVCSNENYFSVLVALSIVTIHHQSCPEKLRDEDNFMLAMLTLGQHKEEIAHPSHSASATFRDCTTLLHTVKVQKVCRSVFCAVCGTGRTPLN